MFELPIPSRGELLLMAAIAAALTVGAWELLKLLTGYIDVSITLQ